jgi:hypothetical protein
MLVVLGLTNQSEDALDTQVQFYDTRAPFWPESFDTKEYIHLLLSFNSRTYLGALAAKIVLHAQISACLVGFDTCTPPVLPPVRRERLRVCPVALDCDPRRRQILAAFALVSNGEFAEVLVILEQRRIRALRTTPRLAVACARALSSSQRPYNCIHTQQVAQCGSFVQLSKGTM